MRKIIYRSLLSFMVVVICAGANRLHAQADTVFFDLHWNETAQANAAYYRLVERKGDVYAATDYFMNGRVQMTGSFSNKSCSIGDGYFVHYDSTGNKTYEGTEHKGNRTGEWKYYFAHSSMLKGTCTYRTDVMEGHSVYYDSLSGGKKREGEYCNDKKCGAWKHYYPGSGKLRFEMNAVDGKWDGVLKGYYEDGKLKREDVFRAGELVRGTCYAPDGKKIKHVPFFTGARFDGDVIKFVKDHIHYPAAAAKDSIVGYVTVGFTVQEDGSLTDIKLLNGIGGGCDEEALRIMHLMPRWQPARIEGEAMEDKLVRKIHFPFKVEIID